MGGGYRFLVELPMRRLRRAVLVKNIHPGTMKERLLDHFSKFGDVERVIMKHCPVTGIYLGEAIVLMRNESDALSIIRMRNHQISRPKNKDALTCAYFRNAKSKTEKGPFKLFVTVKLPFLQKTPWLQQRMGSYLLTVIWRAFHNLSLTACQLMRGGPDNNYLGNFEVRFAKLGDKEAVFNALKEERDLEVLSFVWMDTRDPGYQKEFYAKAEGVH